MDYMAASANVKPLYCGSVSGSPLIAHPLNTDDVHSETLALFTVLRNSQ